MATLRERWQAFRNPPAPDEAKGRGRRPGATRPSTRALAGARARLTQDSADDAFGALWGLAARPDREVDWRALQADFPEGLVWLAYYTEESKDERPARFDARNGTVVLDRTRTLDATLAGFSDAVQENTLPAAARAIGGGDYYKHLTALVRVVEERAGRAGTAVARYVAPGADHYGHAEGYAWAATQAAGATSLGVAIGRGAKGW